MKNKTKINKVLKTHTFCFNPNDNGGESLFLTTKFISNGDKITNKDGVYVNQELTLQSYCNSSSINLSGTTLTSENLRKLANQLETERNSLM